MLLTPLVVSYAHSLSSSVDEWLSGGKGPNGKASQDALVKETRSGVKARPREEPSMTRPRSVVPPALEAGPPLPLGMDDPSAHNPLFPLLGHGSYARTQEAGDPKDGKRRVSFF